MLCVQKSPEGFQTEQFYTHRSINKRDDENDNRNSQSEHTMGTKIKKILGCVGLIFIESLENQRRILKPQFFVLTKLHAQADGIRMKGRN